MNFSKKELFEAFEYLDELRESGETNMFGAAPNIVRDLERPLDEARALLSIWMKFFRPTTDMETRVLNAFNSQDAA